MIDPRELDVEAIRKRCEAATEGPWKSDDKHTFGNRLVRQDPENWNGMGYQFICGLPVAKKGSHYGDMFLANAEFIAHARQDIPALLSALAARDARIVEECEVAEAWRVQSRQWEYEASVKLAERDELRAQLFAANRVVAAAKSLTSVYPKRCTAPPSANHPENCHCGHVILERDLDSLSSTGGG